MLYVFFGKDTVGARRNAHNFAQTYSEKGVRIERIDSTNFQPGIVLDAVGSTSLFGEETLYVLDMPSTHDDFKQELEEALETIASSTGMYVVIEGGLLAPEKKRYAKYAVTMEESSKESASRFNTFALCDALTSKNKKQLWMGLCEAKAENIAYEEIIGTLWWQLKTLRLVAYTSSAEEAGMKEFTYSKAKRALASFKEGEVERLSQSLLAVYHEGHAGKKDIDLALEKWTLSL